MKYRVDLTPEQRTRLLELLAHEVAYERADVPGANPGAPWTRLHDLIEEALTVHEPGEEGTRHGRP